MGWYDEGIKAGADIMAALNGIGSTIGGGFMNLVNAGTHMLGGGASGTSYTQSFSPETPTGGMDISAPTGGSLSATSAAISPVIASQVRDFGDIVSRDSLPTASFQAANVDRGTVLGTGATFNNDAYVNLPGARPQLGQDAGFGLG